MVLKFSKAQEFLLVRISGLCKTVTLYLIEPVCHPGPAALTTASKSKESKDLDSSLNRVPKVCGSKTEGKVKLYLKVAEK